MQPCEDATIHQGEGTRRSTLRLAGVGELSIVHFSPQERAFQRLHYKCILQMFNSQILVAVD